MHHLSWLTWSHKWWSQLTDFEWDLKDPLRTTSFLAVTTPSVPICNYVFHMHAPRASWHGGYSPQLWIKRSWVWVLAAVVWCCVLGHFTGCGMCTVSTQEWMGSWLDSDLLPCLNFYHCCDGSRGRLYAPQGVELVLEQTGPIPRETDVKYIEILSNVALYKYTQYC